MQLRLILIAFLAFSSTSFADDSGQASVTFVRPFDAMTASHNVKLSIDKKEVSKLFHDELFQIELSVGKHTFQTSVGFSLGVPNVTGFNGAKKFKKKFDLSEGEQFFMVEFKPGLMGGKHEISPISREEFDELVKEKSTEHSE